jgi:plasmid stabilization system protein ParE
MPNDYLSTYLPSFENDVDAVRHYIAYNLGNPIAADRLVEDIERAIKKRLLNPTGYRKYVSAKERKQHYYTIPVKNYLIFYVVTGNTMEIRRFIYNKRNLPDLV